MSYKKFRPQVVNANKHTEKGLALLDKSIRGDGWIGAITVAADGETFDGSARLERVADVMPSAEPIVIDIDGTRPVILRRTDIPDANDKRAKRLGVAANITASVDWNPDGQLLALLASEDDAIKAMLKADEAATRAVLEAANEQVGEADAEPQIDRAAELNEKWQVKTGDLWQIGGHRLLCGDSTRREDVERVMGGEKAAFSFTDPPYNVGVDYTKDTNDKKSRQAFIEWCKSWVEFLPSKFCLTVGVKRLLWWDDITGDPQWIIEWIKRNGQSNTGLGGTNKHDPILVYGCARDGGIDIIEVNNDYSEKLVSGGNHPTPKPVELWSKIIERFSETGEVVFEPFGGTGTTLIACQNISRKCRAIEISPNYCAVILDRMERAFPTLAIHRVES